MKNWIFKPWLTPYDTFMIFFISEWLFTSYGVVSSLVVLFFYLMIGNIIQEKLYKVEKLHD